MNLIKVIILKEGKDEVEQVITPLHQRVFIIIGDVVYMADASTNRMYFYPTKEHRETQLCKAHQKIVEANLD